MRVGFASQALDRTFFHHWQIHSAIRGRVLSHAAAEVGCLVVVQVPVWSVLKCAHRCSVSRDLSWRLGVLWIALTLLVSFQFYFMCTSPWNILKRLHGGMPSWRGPGAPRAGLPAPALLLELLRLQPNPAWQPIFKQVSPRISKHSWYLLAFSSCRVRPWHKYLQDSTSKSGNKGT